MVMKVFPHGAIELYDKEKHNVFKANGQRVKPYYDGFPIEVLEELNLEDPQPEN